MKAMILAAGRGTRMAPLTDNCPKPLIPLAGKPLIVHHIEKLVAAGINDLVINHAWLGHMLEQQLGDGAQFGARIRYSPEIEGGLETGGGIFQALPLLGSEPFLVVNGDVWTNWNYQQATTQKLGANLAWLYLVNNPDHHPEGDFALKEQQVCLKSPQAQPQDCYTFSGISVLHPKLFATSQAGRYPLAPMLRAMMPQGLVGGSLLNAKWVDVGTPERLQQLEQSL